MKTILAIFLKKISSYKLYELSLLVVIIIFFLLTNFLSITFSYFLSGNLLSEIVRWIQFIIIIFLTTVLLNKISKIWSFLTISFFFFLYYSLIIYYVFTHSRLDYSFFIRNIKDISHIMEQAAIPLFIIFLSSIFNSIFIFFSKNKLTPKINKNKPIYFILFLIFLFPTLLSAKNLNNELIIFAKSIYTKDLVINYYQKKYLMLVNSSSGLRNIIKPQTEEIKQKQLPNFLDNIIILHLESLNEFLVNNENTPNFMSIANEGVLFPKFYGNSIQTILAYENIFCSMPSSFDRNLVDSDFNKQVLCLPEILGDLGYKNYFFKGGASLKAANTDRFIKNIKFDELHNRDIMDDGDEKYQWGYREDLFYKKSFTYLSDKTKDTKNFIYIDVGSTNHWPFKTPLGYEDIVPFKYPKNHLERFTNTTFLQDMHLKVAWNEINKMFPEKNYTLIVMGDHSWPVEAHPGNTYNEKNAFEENFTTAMALVIGGETKYKNLTINTIYSQMDILPSILDLFGINLPNNDYRRSFMREINGENPPEAKIILIQPYADRYINIIDNRKKYQYNSEENIFTFYDLLNDSLEANGKIIGSNNNENLEILKKIYQ